MEIFGRESLPKFLSSLELEKLSRLSKKIAIVVKAADNRATRESLNENTFHSKKLLEIVSEKSMDTSRDLSIQKQ